MAKSRAQRKAERRAREAAKKSGATNRSGAAERARHDTQVPKSGDIAEIEAIEAGIEAGAPEELLEVPDAPAPRRRSRAEERAEKKRRREAEKRELAERERREREKLAKSKEKATGQRTGVIGFLVSCWAELKKVQWPDRDTLIQATIVTIIFVVVAAAYLGGLDLIFSEVMKQIL
jgi:preprotein translocase subunit SecE